MITVGENREREVCVAIKTDGCLEPPVGATEVKDVLESVSRSVKRVDDAVREFLATDVSSPRLWLRSGLNVQCFDERRRTRTCGG